MKNMHILIIIVVQLRLLLFFYINKKNLFIDFMQELSIIEIEYYFKQ